MLTIRLTRVGKKNDPSFRVIVVESKRKPQPGNYLENVGSYEPKSGRIELKADRIKHWISMGATVSDTVHNMLISQKIIEGKKINILPKYVAPAAEAAPEAPAPAAEAPQEAPVEEPVAPEPAADTITQSPAEQA